MAQAEPVLRSVSSIDPVESSPPQNGAAPVYRRSSSSPMETVRKSNGSEAPVASTQKSSPGGGDVMPEIVFRNKILNGSATDMCHCKPEFRSRSQEETAELVRRRSASILEVKEQVHQRLKEELLRAQSELKLKDEECQKLSRVQDQLNIEVEELTAKLFEEANNMVQDAHVKRMQAEKLLKESNSKIEVLQAEVTALKTLVITSTPSMPNRHLHPHIEPPPPPQKEKKSIFKKGHRRATSHHIFKEMHPIAIETPTDSECGMDREVEPVSFEEFKCWRASQPSSLQRDCTFLHHIIQDDITPCLSFPCSEMAQQVFESVMSNSLVIEPMPEKNPFPRKCALTGATRVCKFRICIGDSEQWHVVSNIARNRVASVCDLVTYLRYITLGLVKSQDNDIYWEIIRLRKQMNLARLGLS